MSDQRQYVENIATLLDRRTRTKFDMSGPAGGLKLMTMNKGLLYPVYTIEVLPGDTWKINVKALIRAQTLIKPIMNNMWAQIQCYFVPNRLTCEKWEEIMGANKQGPWITNKTTYEVPKLAAPNGGWAEKSLADYLGVPTKVGGIQISSLYTKGYCQICNDWYRDENRMNFTHITTGNTNLTGSNGTNYVTDIELGGCLFPVAKAFDLFTGSLIQPQKGPSVLLPLGATAPVSIYGNGKVLGFDTKSGLNTGLVYTTNNSANKLSMSEASYGQNLADASVGTAPNNIDVVGLSSDPTKSGISGIADLSGATAANINDVRLAVAVQHMLELDALAGTRYTEILYAEFGVRSSDARLQRSEYLGGKSVPIQITQVIQNSESNTTPQGNLAGMSQTYDGDDYFTKSFEEHGIMYIVCCIKGENIYQQGLPAKFSKFKRTDFYSPIYGEGLGAQPIYNREIYAQGSSVVNPNTNVAYDDEAFGYKEPWAEYRTLEKEVAGEFRSNASNTIDYWHIARDFASLPTNGEAFIQEGKDNLDRALTVASSVADQFQAAFAIDAQCVRIMSAHGVPGLRRF